MRSSRGKKSDSSDIGCEQFKRIKPLLESARKKTAAVYLCRMPDTSSPGPAGPDLPDIDAFCDALWLEDGLAANTLAAYRRDLGRLARWLRQQYGVALLAAQEHHLQHYFAFSSGRCAAG